MMDEDFYDDLAERPNLGSLEKLIGTELTIQLSQDFGGVRLQIPLKPGPNSPLSASVGLAAALKIAQVYGGMTYDVPLNPGKRAEIRALNAQGWTAKAIARKVRCSVRMVYTIRADVADEKQAKLPF